MLSARVFRNILQQDFFIDGFSLYGPPVALLSENRGRRTDERVMRQPKGGGRERTNLEILPSDIYVDDVSLSS